MRNYSAIIADDEEHLCTHLCSLLEKLWPELQVLGVAHSGSDALTLIKQQEPDIAFLDIRMPVMNGIKVASHCSDICHTVFITAYDEYAIQAFEQDAIDYLLKPVTHKRLSKTIERLRHNLTHDATPDQNWQQLIKKLSAAIGVQSPAALQWIRAGQDDKTLLIAVEDILFFRAADKYTSVITHEGEFLIRKPIKELADELDGQYFWQINRGVIVNIPRIASTKRELSGRYTLTLKDYPETLSVSRNFAHLFRQM
jgi:DNA-binding LytR/AlgR family response regulator